MPFIAWHTRSSEKRQQLNVVGGTNMFCSYIFWVPNFHIESIRSAGTDTLYASTSLRVMNENGGLHQDYGSKTIPLGDHKGKATVDLHLSLAYQDVYVPEPSQPGRDGGAVFWTFLLANAGHKDSGFAAVLGKAADAYAGAFAGASIPGGSGGVSAFMSLASVLAVQELLTLFTANCDGMVAAGNLAYTKKNLDQMCPQLNVPWSKSDRNPGTDSPPGCGDKSCYDVNYEIMAQMPIAPPVR